MTDPQKLFVKLYGKTVSPIPIKLKNSYNVTRSEKVETKNITDRQLSAIIVNLIYSKLPFTESSTTCQAFNDNNGVEHILESGCTDYMIKSGLVSDEGGEWGNKTLKLTKKGELEIKKFLTLK
ncbi:MAG: hypothetical protein COV35_04475 [Alphaproteobacteria bacterium CG11_big_fil_rev_8_21_14_0_20_39_49]|nr:MAG: hypothetical protein COV35_04475 [Alphaproteobacteria bacterium CG11_big_fil_rev_8_21_14_0_20_39_49]